MEPSQTPSGEYEIRFYLTKESFKQFAADTQKIAGKEMSIWGKNGKIASAEISEPISGGTFYLQGQYSLQEAKEKINQLSK